MNKLLFWLLNGVFITGFAAGSDECIRLGSHPSLIVKFKSQNSDLKRTEVNTAELTTMGVPGITLEQSRPMSNGAYVVFFKPNSALAKASGAMQGPKMVKPGCYSKESVDDMMQIVKSNPDVEYAEPNRLLKPVQESGLILPSITPQSILPEQWALLSPPGGIDVTGAWTYTKGKNAIIAVLDTGIIYHPSLSDNILSGVHFNNSGEIGPGATQTCTTCDGYEHGTHVAGTIASSGNGAYGKAIYGVAPEAKVLPVNVFTVFSGQNDCGTSGKCLLAYTSDYNNAINWLAGTKISNIDNFWHKVAGINLSLGGESDGCATSSQSAINKATAAGITIAVAAGNEEMDAQYSEPANCKNVITVAATNHQGHRSSYSNYGKVVAIAAPGGDGSKGIISTVNGGYAAWQGTSMATPHVAGVVALLYSLDSNLNYSKVLAVLQKTATPFPSASGCTTSLCGAGILNAGAAVASIASNPTELTLVWPLRPYLFKPIPGTKKITISWPAVTVNGSASASISYKVTTTIKNLPKVLCTTTKRSCTVVNVFSRGTYRVDFTATDLNGNYPTAVKTVTYKVK